MNFRLTATALLILIVLAGMVFYIASGGPAPRHKLVNKAVFDPKPATLSRIKFVQSGEKPKVFVRAGTHWKIVKPMTAWGRDFKIGDIGDSVRGLTYEYRVPVEATGTHSAKSLGLAPPRAVLTLTDNTGKKFILNIGRRTVSGRLYVQPALSSHWACVVHAGWFHRIGESIARFRNKNLTRFHIKAVEGFVIHHGGHTIRMQKIHGRWMITVPVRMPAKPSAVSDWLSNLQSLHAHAFSSIPADAAGLSNPVATVKVQLAEPTTMPGSPKSVVTGSKPLEPVVVKFGRYTDLTRKRIYADSNEDPGTAIVAGLSMDQLIKPLDQFRDHALTRAKVGIANQISILRTAGEIAPHLPAPQVPALYLIKSSTGQWRMGTTHTGFEHGPMLEASPHTLTAMTKALAKLRAKQFIDSNPNLMALGLNPPVASMQLQIPGRVRPWNLLIGRQQKDGLIPLKRPSWPSVYLVTNGDVAKLLPQPTALRSKTVADISSQSITAVRITQSLPARSVLFTQQGGKWKLEKAVAVAPVPSLSSMQHLVADLARLRTTRWLAIHPPQAVHDMFQVNITISKLQTASIPTGATKLLPAGPPRPVVVHTTLTLWRVSDGKSPAIWEGTCQTDGAKQNWVFEASPSLVKAIQAITAPGRKPAATPALKKAG